MVDDALKAGVTIDIAELTQNDSEKSEHRLFESV